MKCRFIVPILVLAGLSTAYSDSTVTVLIPGFNPPGADSMNAGEREHLQVSLNRAHRLTRIGTGLLVSGLTLQTIAVVGTGGSNDPGFAITGLVLQIGAPIISGIGGNIASTAMNEVYPGYPRHEGWKWFIAAGALSAATVVAVPVGLGISGRSLAGAKITAGVTVLLGLSSEISSISAVLSPFTYIRRAKQTIK